ncbi:MAG: branched-chain amino acid ABC transporter permease [bacterium]|nr:branched-chain amino acid ABC transporter permease [bacterium]
MRRSEVRRVLVGAGWLGVAWLVTLPMTGVSRYVTHMAVIAGIYAILALGLFVVTGLTGQLSLGQAGAWGVGAYTSALLTTRLGWDFWYCLPAVVLVSLLVGIGLGLPSLKVSGLYLAMITVGFVEIARLVFLNWISLTGGPMGVINIPPPSVLGQHLYGPRAYYPLVVVFLALTILFVWRLTNSRVGVVLRTVADSEVAARSVGINTVYYKVLAFAISTCLGGIAGSLYAHYVTYIDPPAFSLAESIFLLIVIIVGGKSSLLGVVGAAILLTFGLEYLKALREYRMIVYGLMLLGCIIFLPKGVGGYLEELWQRLFAGADRAGRQTVRTG